MMSAKLSCNNPKKTLEDKSETSIENPGDINVQEERVLYRKTDFTSQ